MPSPRARRVAPPSPWRVVAAAAIAGALALLAPGAAAAQAPAERACLGDVRARCATLTVPTDHRGAVPGSEHVAYARVPAVGPRTGTLVFLTGGPGEEAIALAPLVAQLLDPLRDRYDLVLVDQRGTGESDPVRCGRLATRHDVAACADRLGPRRAFLTARDTAFDLEDLRGALGADRLTLLGVSYGTKIAAEYARRFPERTAALVLDSPTPVDGLDAILELRQVGLPRILREICFPGACREAVRDAPAALATLVHRLQRRPLPGRIAAADGRPRRRTLTEAALYELMLVADLDPLLRGELPAAIASGALGDAAPLLRLTAAARALGRGDPGGINPGRLLATSCIEGRLPWAPDAPLAGRDAALAAALAGKAERFAPFSRRTVLAATPAAACLAWPPTPAPEPVADLGPALPALVLAGREDLRTPLEDARRSASRYPGARVLAVPDAGHSVLGGSDPGGCAIDGLVAFLGGQPVPGCPRRARRPLPSAALLPADLAGLRPAPGTRGRPGRTATAVGATVHGVERAAVRALTDALGRARAVRVPGLRRGVAVLRGGTLTLRDVEWVRGVRVSGRLGDGGARLVVAGPAAAPGVLTRGAGRTLRGTLGGERVAVRPPSSGLD
jgi:pimeloyl-ACP methyl ester carboxylesterase